MNMISIEINTIRYLGVPNIKSMRKGGFNFEDSIVSLNPSIIKFVKTVMARMTRIFKMAKARLIFLEDIMKNL